MTVRVTASMGIAVHPDHGSVLSDLLRCADIAMYEAKQSRMVVRLYRPEGDSRTRDQLALLDDLRTVDWDRELVPALPADARPAHERDPRRRGAGEMATSQLRPALPQRLRAAGGTHRARPRTHERGADAGDRPARPAHRHGDQLQMSVNISRYDLLDDELPDLVARLLHDGGVDPTRLTLEITETSLVEEPAHSRRSIERLRAQGIRISIDDFGVGYSSMSQLLQLSVDQLKIDKSFVLALGADDRAKAVISATIELARALGLTVVAEGIENLHSLSVVSGSAWTSARATSSPCHSPCASSWTSSRTPPRSARRARRSPGLPTATARGGPQPGSSTCAVSQLAADPAQVPRRREGAASAHPQEGHGEDRPQERGRIDVAHPGPGGHALAARTSPTAPQPRKTLRAKRSAHMRRAGEISLVLVRHATSPSSSAVPATTSRATGVAQDTRP